MTDLLTFVPGSPLDVGDWSDSLDGVKRRRGSGVDVDVPDFDELVSPGGGESIALLRMPVDGEDRTVMTLNMEFRFIRATEVPYLNITCEKDEGFNRIVKNQIAFFPRNQGWVKREEQKKCLKICN